MPSNLMGTKVESWMWASPDLPLKVLYFDDESMNQSAYEISQILESEGVAEGAYKAFNDLRLMAFKADLWRYMLLWERGGVFLDADIVLNISLSKVIDFHRDTLVVTNDTRNFVYWNAVMAGVPRLPGLAAAVKFAVEHVQRRWCGDRPVHITGPGCLYTALAQLNLSSVYRIGL